MMYEESFGEIVCIDKIIEGLETNIKDLEMEEIKYNNILRKELE